MDHFRQRLGNFRKNPIDHGPQGHLLVGELQGPGKLQEFRHHMGQRARLLQDQFTVLAQLRSGLRLASNHLRVA